MPDDQELAKLTNISYVRLSEHFKPALRGRGFLWLTHLCRRHALQSIDRLLPLLFDADEKNVVGLGHK